MFPPHLPPPTCDIERHKMWQRLKMLLAASVFGLIAGMSGASMILGWVWPGFAGGDFWARTYNSTTVSRRQAEETAESKMDDKIFALYSRSTPVVSGSTTVALSASDKLADAVVVSSNGWMVAYNPAFDGKYKDWRAVGNNGTVYTVVRAVFDKRMQWVFFKAAPIDGAGAVNEQFKSAVFGSIPERFDDVFVYSNGVWASTYVQGRSILNNVGEGHLDTNPSANITLGSSFKDGSVAIDAQGNVVGFAMRGANMQSLSFLNTLISVNDLESVSEIKYPTLGLEGWFGSEKAVAIDGEVQPSFVVNKVLANKNIFRRGDVITAINGRSLTDTVLWGFARDERASVKLVRNGKAVDVEAVWVKL